MSQHPRPRSAWASRAQRRSTVTRRMRPRPRADPLRALHVGRPRRDFPEVTGLEVEWKLTPVDRLRPLIDGELDGSPYAILYPEVAGTDGRVDRPRPTPASASAGTPEERASANAWTSFEKALPSPSTGEVETALTVHPHRPRRRPARRAHRSSRPQPNSTRPRRARQPRRRARSTENVEIVVDDGAHLTVVSVQEWDDDAAPPREPLRPGRPRTPHLKHIVVSLGGSVVRVNPSAHLAERRRRRRAVRRVLRRRRPAPRAAGLRAPRRAAHPQPRQLQGRAARRGRAHRLGRRRADRPRRRRHRQLRAEPQPRAQRGHARRLASRTSRSRPATSSAPATPARPAASTTSSCSTCSPAASPRTRRAASSCSASSARSCRRSASPSSRRACTPPSRPNWRRAAMSAQKVLRARRARARERRERVVLDGIPIAVVQRLGRRRARHRRHLHARRHLAVRGLRRRRHPRVLGPRLRSSRSPTGKPLTLPAYEPVPVFAVEIIDGDVYIDPTRRRSLRRVSTHVAL